MLQFCPPNQTRVCKSKQPPFSKPRRISQNPTFTWWWTSMEPIKTSALILYLLPKEGRLPKDSCPQREEGMILQSIKSGSCSICMQILGAGGDAESAYLAHPWLDITGEISSYGGEGDLLKIRWVYCWGWDMIVEHLKEVFFGMVFFLWFFFDGFFLWF